MYLIEKQITKFEQPNQWVRYNKYLYDKQTAKKEVSFLSRAYRDIKFRITLLDK